MTEIITLGEVLIDLTQTEVDEKGICTFAAFPGGAPANVAVAASRLGARAGFIGKVGEDAFGRELRETLEKDAVDTSYLFTTAETPTTLAIVSVDAKGERSFAFYRQPGADTQLTAEEATAFLVGGDAGLAAGRSGDQSGQSADQCGSSSFRSDSGELPKILHFGSLSLTTEPSRTAALTAAREAKAQGILISYDPNYRDALWKSEEEAIQWMKIPLSMADILKVSDEELVMLTGCEDLEEGSRILAEYGIRLVMVTLGSEGVFYRLQWDDSMDAETAGTCGIVPAVPVSVCDTNGAGDTFLGAVLAEITKCSTISEEELRKMLAFANRAAAITCSRAGAIPAMPTREEVERAFGQAGGSEDHV